MKKIIKILVIFFFFFSSNQAYSEKHNQVSVELDRIKNDIIDLQKFVYKNESSLGKSANSSEKNNIEELKILINDISKSIALLEKQILDIKMMLVIFTLCIHHLTLMKKKSLALLIN